MHDKKHAYQLPPPSRAYSINDSSSSGIVIDNDDEHTIIIPSEEKL
jgi:hypothetical protein